MRGKPLDLSTALPVVARRLKLDDVYRAHIGDVVRWATRLHGRSQEAGDIAQEVFCVVQRRLATFSLRNDKLEPWLFRITENVVRSRRRKERLAAWLFGQRSGLQELPFTGLGPLDALQAQADVRMTYQVLDALSDSDRSLLVLFELEGYPGEKVAEMLSIKPSVIWVRLHRARGRFLSKLQQLDPEVAP